MASLTIPRELKNVKRLQDKLKVRSEKYWQQRGQRMALNLFHEMSRDVPAYKDFLKKNSFDPQKVKSVEDLINVPIINKDNYLRQYSRQDLCWGGSFAEGRWVISSTSGSTGEPFYFPRTDLQDKYYEIVAELYLRENFQIQDKSTLYIDAFAMGAWIGGVFTYEAIKRVAAKGYKLSLITPGVNKAEVINNVKKLGPDFDQVIIGCYPPILKDIIDLGVEGGINWGEYNLGVVFSAEGFSEQFRDYIYKYAKLGNIYTSTLNHYGTVDLGTMSHETAASIMVRRQAVENNILFGKLFGDISRQPTLTQYLPELFYFEEVDENIICSSYSGIPLVRYDLKDHGGVLSESQIKKAYKSSGVDFSKELEDHGIADKYWNLPFVYLYERSDFSVTFSGAQIYPQEIHKALLDKSLNNKITGKFTMISIYDKNARNYLELNIELRKNIIGDSKLRKVAIEKVVNQLLKDNSEYRVLYSENKKALIPKIKFWDNEHDLYFSGRGKQKWVKN